ncbi:WAT1-related protein [Trifolium medium]|uniref:WAT1-related protein n=1 Tax=Trifolium medium TaxID=97028 RepID=A0A392NAG1_9FABA|nr:WAT1-related protein [Trifolium medium]
MNNHVFIAYAYAVGTSVLLPVTLFTRRSRVVPPLTFSIICKSVLLGAIGSLTPVHALRYPHSLGPFELLWN